LEKLTLDEVSKILKISNVTARNRFSLGLGMPPHSKLAEIHYMLNLNSICG